jgi:hypothetical protein
MTTVLRWLTRQAIFVYLACIMGAVLYALTGLAARRRREAAQFSLERDVNQQRMLRSFLISGLFLILAVIVFLIANYVEPWLQDVPETTPTLVGILTLTPTPLVLPTADLTIGAAALEGPNSATMTAEFDSSLGSVVTQTVVAPLLDVATPTPVQLPTPTEAEVPQPDCPSPNAQLVLPVAGANVSGLVEVRGTATMNAFSYYKFEVQFPGSDIPNFISQYDIPVQNDLLGYWDVSDPTRYPRGGFYRFRLVVVDIYGNTAICTIPVRIVEPEQPGETSLDRATPPPSPFPRNAMQQSKTAGTSESRPSRK